MRSFNRRRGGRRITVISGVILAFVIIGIVVQYNWKKEAIQAHEEDKIEVYEVELQGDSLVPLYESGVGTGVREDSYLIESSEDSVLAYVFPGRAYIQSEAKNMAKKMSRNIDGETYSRIRLYTEYDYVIFYDLETGKEIKKIDIDKAVKTTIPDFQAVSGCAANVGENGKCYLKVRLENIPEKATDEEVEKILFIDIDTGETVIKESDEEAWEFTWGQRTEEEKEYDDMIDNADWEAFEERNQYNRADSESMFYVSIAEATRGCAKVGISCAALPEDNAHLYERFPGLEKWIGEEGKEAKIYIGGYPTVEEIMAMFERQEPVN